MRFPTALFTRHINARTKKAEPSKFKRMAAASAKIAWRRLFLFILSNRHHMHSQYICMRTKQSKGSDPICKAHISIHTKQSKGSDPIYKARTNLNYGALTEGQQGRSVRLVPGFIHPDTHETGRFDQ